MNTNNISVPISWLSPVDWPGNYSIFSLLKLARVETFEGGKRTLLECQQINLNGLVLKRDCTVLSRIEKQPCPSGHHVFPFIVGVGRQRGCPLFWKEVVMLSNRDRKTSGLKPFTCKRG